MPVICLSCLGQGEIRVRENERRGVFFTSKVSSSFGFSLNKSIARDLLRIGQAVFLADRAFRRGARLGNQMRFLRLVVPVQAPAFWKSVADELASLAEFVSHDIWHFEFIQSNRTEKLAMSKKLRNVQLPQNSCVSLFSNGLDSLCGLAAAIKRHELPILVSHSPPGFKHVSDRSRLLAGYMHSSAKTINFVNFNFQVHDSNACGRRSLFPERSRRTRPMLFLCMAGAVGIELDVPIVYINENGVLATNLPFRAHLSGSQISRHAHPETLQRFQCLLRRIWPYCSVPTVVNPFSDLTKGEELSYLGAAKPLALKTISCEYARQQVAHLIKWRRQRKGNTVVRECGLCLPCLIRRAALHRAEIQDPASHYAFDYRIALRNPTCYANAPLFRTVAHHIHDVLEFCRKIRRMKPSTFVLEYAYELSLTCKNLDVSACTRASFRLYRRFAKEMLFLLEGNR